MGGPDIEAGQAILNRANIPTFAYPDDAAQAFTYMWRFSSNLKSLYETPVLPAAGDPQSTRSRAGELIKTVLGSGRDLLTEAESKQLLSIYGIPTVETRVAKSEVEAIAAAKAIGLSGGAQALLRDHHAQDRRRRGQAQHQGRRRRDEGLRRDQEPASRRRRARSTSRASRCSR